MPLIGTVATGAASQSPGTTSFTMQTTSTITVGTTLVGTIGIEAGSGTNPPTLTVSDIHGNPYVTDKQVVNGTTVSVSIFSCRVTTQINSGENLTATISGASVGTRIRWVGTVQAYNDILSARNDQSATATGGTTAINAGTTGVTTVANELVYAGFAMSMGNSPTFTAGSGYTASTFISTGGTTNRGCVSEWKYVTSTGAQNPTGTLSATATWAGAAMTYKTSATNQTPTANAGPDQNVTVGSTVQLDGSGSSDPDGTIASYSWTQISGTSVTLSSSSVVNPTFTAPASPATLVFGLTVTDNSGATSPQDTVTINVANKVGYVAEAASAVSTTSANSFTLNYSKTVPAGHTILMGIVVDAPVDAAPSFAQIKDSKNNTYSVDVTAYRTSTVATVIASCYLTTSVSASDTITLTLTAGDSRGRWAISAAEFDNIHQTGLDVTAHNDNPSTGNPLTVGPTATTQNQTEVVFASFGFGTANSNVFSVGTNFSAAGTQHSTGTTSGHRGIGNEYRIYTASAVQTATATLTPAAGYSGSVATYAADVIADIAPTANAGPNQTVAAFDTVTLDGTGSTDTDGNVTGYSWTQTVGPTVTLSSSTVAQPTFTAPGVDGGTSVTFSLVVTDNLGTNSTNNATVTITVNSAENFVAHGGSWTPMQELAAHTGTWS